MSYEFTAFEPTKLSLEVKFSNPTEVSQGDVQDKLVLSLLKEYLANDGTSPPSKRMLATDNQSSIYTESLLYITLTVPLPQMMSSQEEKENIESAADTAETILFIQLIGPLVLQLFV